MSSVLVTNTDKRQKRIVILNEYLYKMKYLINVKCLPYKKKAKVTLLDDVF